MPPRVKSGPILNPPTPPIDPFSTGLGGTFTPGGFVPNKPKVKAAPNQAPYKPGQSPTQRAQATAQQQGAIKVVGRPKNENDARQHAATMATQRMLNAHGAHLVVDGQWGPATDSAYQAYLHHAQTFRAHTQHLDATTNPLSAPAATQFTPEGIKAEAQAQKAAQRAAARARLAASQPHLEQGGGGTTPEVRAAQEAHLNQLMGQAARLEQTAPGSPQYTAALRAIHDYTLAAHLDQPLDQLHSTPALTSILGSTAEPGQQEALAAYKAYNEPSPILTGTVNALASGLGANLVAKVANGEHIGAGDIVSTLGNALLTLTPAQMANVAREARLALDAGKGVEAAIPEAQQFMDAIVNSPGMTAAAKKAAIEKSNQFLDALSHYNGEDPASFIPKVIKSATYEDIRPSVETFVRHAEGPTALGHTPIAVHAQAARSNFDTAAKSIFEDTVKNAGKTKLENILPPGIDTPEKLSGLMKELQLRAQEAADFRHWYERSGRAILEHTGGDPAEATKLAALVAAYSPQAEVYSRASEWNNLNRALRAYDQFQATGTVPHDVSISKHLAESGGDWQTRNAQNIMEGKIDWNGLKTNRFFRNFLEHIDPETYAAHFGNEQFSTQDLWMARAFKYADDKVKGGNAAGEMTGQYKFMHDVTKAVGDSLGWTPSETQAAIWTNIKAETEKTPLEVAGGDFSHGLEHAMAREHVKRFFGVSATHNRGEYLDVLKRVSEALGRTIPASGKLSPGARVEAEQALSMWARTSEDPAARAWRTVTNEVKQAHAMKSLQAYFADGNALLDKIASAQGREVLAQGGAEVKGATARYAEGGAHVTLFRGADASTVVHELTHAAEKYMPRDLVEALGHDAEERARTVEAYFARHDSVIGHAIRETYGGAHVPGGFLTRSAQAKLDAFFRSDVAMGHDFTKIASEILAQHTHPYSISAEHDASPSAKTLWHNGPTDIAGANRGIGEGDLLHFHAYDEHGNLVGAAHGADHGDRVHLTSVKVLPEHEGRGVGTALVQQFRDVAGERPLSSTFQNEALGAREVARSQALGRETGFDTNRWETLFQTHDNSIERVVADAKEPDGGATLNPDLTPHRGGGYAVSIPGHEEVVPASAFDKATLEKYIETHAAALKQPGNKIGVWHNPEDGNVYLDISQVHPTRKAAMYEAHKADQLAIYDLNKFESIPTEAPSKAADFLNWRGTGAARTELADAVKAFPSDLLKTFREYGMKPEDLRALHYPEEASNAETLFQQAAEHDGSSHWQGSASALADMHGVDIAAVPPTGEGGRVTVADVERYVFQQMPPADQLKSLLQGLSVQRGKQEAGYSAERSKRFGEVRGIRMNENLSNEEARAAMSDAMKGELPKIIVNGHAREMSQETLDALVSQVRYHPTLSDGQMIRVWDALNALVHEGRVPQKSELALMRHVWGKGTTMSLIEEMTKWQKLGRNLGDIINIPRSVMSSMDVSFGLRQALVAAMYDPGAWFKAWRGQFKLLGKWTEGLGAEQGGEAAYKALMEHIYGSPNFPRYQEMGLAITDMEHALGLREEGFQSNLAERLTGGVHSPIRGSGRAYTGMAIKLRTELADRLLADAAAAGQDVHDAQFLQELGHFINGITGRGKFPHRVLEEGSPLLSAIFFSPRLMASRLQMLNPIHYVTGNSFVRKQYIKAGLRFYGTMATILAAIKFFVPGASVTFNPRSSDFGKVKLGNNRIDMGGGFNQFIHLFGEIYTGQKINTTTGQVQSLGHGFGQKTRMDAFINFMEGKLSPSSGIVKDWASDSDPKHLGQGFNTWDEFTSHMVPLIAQDAWQVYNDPSGTGLNGIMAAVAGYGLESTGVGLQNYGPTQPGKATLKKLADEAKATNTPIPPKVEQGMKNLAQLKSYTASYKNDPKGAMKQYIAFYAKTTGDHSLDKYASVTSDEMAKRVMSAIRARLDNGATRYESVIKARAKAKGIK